VDRSGLRPAIQNERYRDTDRGKSVEEVHGPVHRVDQPVFARGVAAQLLADDGYARGLLLQEGANRFLGPAIDLRDVVRSPLELCCGHGGLQDDAACGEGGALGHPAKSLELLALAHGGEATIGQWTNSPRTRSRS
jgi:hypothetical protein